MLYIVYLLLFTGLFWFLVFFHLPRHILAGLFVSCLALFFIGFWKTYTALDLVQKTY